MEQQHGTAVASNPFATVDPAVQQFMQIMYVENEKLISQLKDRKKEIKGLKKVRAAGPVLASPACLECTSVSCECQESARSPCVLAHITNGPLNAGPHGGMQMTMPQFMYLVPHVAAVLCVCSTLQAYAAVLQQKTKENEDLRALVASLQQQAAGERHASPQKQAPPAVQVLGTELQLHHEPQQAAAPAPAAAVSEVANDGMLSTSLPAQPSRPETPPSRQGVQALTSPELLCAEDLPPAEHFDDDAGEPSAPPLPVPDSGAVAPAVPSMGEPDRAEDAGSGRQMTPAKRSRSDDVADVEQDAMLVDEQQQDAGACDAAAHVSRPQAKRANTMISTGSDGISAAAAAAAAVAQALAAADTAANAAVKRFKALTPGKFVIGSSSIRPQQPGQHPTSGLLSCSPAQAAPAPAQFPCSFLQRFPAAGAPAMSAQAPPAVQDRTAAAVRVAEDISEEDAALDSSSEDEDEDEDAAGLLQFLSASGRALQQQQQLLNSMPTPAAVAGSSAVDVQDAVAVLKAYIEQHSSRATGTNTYTAAGTNADGGSHHDAGAAAASAAAALAAFGVAPRMSALAGSGAGPTAFAFSPQFFKQAAGGVHMPQSFPGQPTGALTPADAATALAAAAAATAPPPPPAFYTPAQALSAQGLQDRPAPITDVEAVMQRLLGPHHAASAGKAQHNSAAMAAAPAAPYYGAYGTAAAAGFDSYDNPWPEWQGCFEQDGMQNGNTEGGSIASNRRKSAGTLTGARRSSSKGGKGADKDEDFHVGSTRRADRDDPSYECGTESNVSVCGRDTSRACMQSSVPTLGPLGTSATCMFAGRLKFS